MKKLRVIAVLISLFIQLPIWWYLIYKILEAVNASELMWFLYWVYLPAGFFATTLLKLTEAENDK